ncbi:flagellar filament capping protein FliD [Marinobacter bryozoorum]|uniref:flagellar filament capping protein FliD n=1 Tax=Marinobacter bryozoorum TaxID=256324 RepID=UPI002004657F|nr:flagellar filament capping protein FliD [Marinobacter bryozoorum]MCK7544827.1 flagellar filament capping protein FliD [Marinobacter bryozoorum]
MAGISSLGVGSGVLNSDLVDQLVAAERKPTETRLDQKTQRTEALISAYGKLRSAVTELRLPMRQLGSADAMKSFSATSSGSNVSASVDASQASRGTYNLNVETIAESHAMAFAAVADRDATSVGQGTMTLQVGDKTTNISIDESNDTLQGVANAINDSDAGVSASILNTGNGYRLVLNSDETGTANQINISNNATDGADFTNFIAGAETTTEAADAKFTINGIEVTKSANTVDDVVDGVTFDITDTGTSTVKVEQDTGAVAERVQGFVDKFNALQDTISELSSFNSDSGQGSILTGDSTVRNIQGQLKSVLMDVIPGLENASVRSLADVGITTDWQTGNLQFDSQKFQQQLQENPDDVTALFAEQGRATDSQVEFVRSGTATQPGDYDINITQAATRGSLNYSAAEAGTVNVMAGNMFTFEVDGETQVSVFLENNPAGDPLSATGDDFTGEEFAAAMQQALNSSNELKAAGRSVNVAWDATEGLTFTSGKYGSDSNVRLTSTLNADINSADGVAGADVAGTIDGQTAQGDGQVLYLGSDAAGGAAGLQVRVTGDETGPRGSVKFIEGVSERAVNTITDILGANGALDSRTAGLNRELERIDEQRAKLETRIQSYQERLISQFSAADSLIAQLNSTRDYVSQQLAALAPNQNSGNG